MTVLLAPERLDLSAAIEDALDPSESVFYYDILNRLGVTELAVFPLDPDAAPGAPGALPDFIYPDGAELGFAQIYSTNFGDGGQLDGIFNVEGEANLLDDIDEIVIDPTFTVLENNAGTVATLPTDFEGKLVVLEKNTDYFLSGELVRTEVQIQFRMMDPDADFAEEVLMFADSVTETTTANGPLYTITDGSLTETEFLNDSPALEPAGAIGASTVVYDSTGAVVSVETSAAVGVSADAEIERYLVEIVASADPNNAPLSQWDLSYSERLVTSFTQVENVAAEEGETEDMSTSI